MNKILLDLFFNFEKNENIAEIKKLLQYAMELSKLVRFRETQIRTILKILFVLIVHSTLFYVNFVTHKRVWRDLRHFTTWSIGLLALLSFYFTYILRNKLWGMFIYLRIETLSFFIHFCTALQLLLCWNLNNVSVKKVGNAVVILYYCVYYLFSWIGF